MPIFTQGTLDFVSHSVEQTERLGYRLGELLRPGDVICLSGDLGAGKTAFARGVGKGWGAVPPVTSPTFVLVHEHTRQADSQRLYHVDGYRLNGLADALSFGLDELMADPNPLLIEWPEHVPGVLPGSYLWITFAMQSDLHRQITFETAGQGYDDLLEAYRKRTFGG